MSVLRYYCPLLSCALVVCASTTVGARPTDIEDTKNVSGADETGADLRDLHSAESPQPGQHETDTVEAAGAPSTPEAEQSETVVLETVEAAPAPTSDDARPDRSLPRTGEPEPHSDATDEPVASRIPSAGKARQGFYANFYAGVQTHMDPNTIDVDLPEFNADSNALSLFEIDFGYTFGIGLSFSLGFELENWVAPNMKMDMKYSFATSEQLQPYIYTCMHGGVVHLFPMAVHVGGGVDYFVSERVYLALDFRGGWKAVRARPRFEQHLEAAISMGFGVRLTGVDD